jgi:hypothetical protein
MSLATVASIVGIAGGGLGIYNGLKGSSNAGGGAGYAPYVPQGSGMADKQWQQYFQSMAPFIGALDQAGGYNLAPGFNAVTQDPYLPGVQKAGVQSGADEAMLARNAGAIQDAMASMAGGQRMLGNWTNDQAMKLWDTALDPQKQLQAQLQQQVQDASRANATSAGLGTSGAGVGTEDKAMSDFLINWQNQQLGRQVQGMQGLTAGLDTGMEFQNNVGRDLAASMAAGSQIPGYDMAAGMDPETAYMMAATRPFLGMDMLGKSVYNDIIQPTNAAGSGAIPYLYAGQGATSQGFNQMQDAYGNLTQGLNTVSQSNPGNIWASMMAAFNNPQQSGGSGNNSGVNVDWSNNYGYTPGI